MSKRTQTNSAEINPKNFWPTPKAAVDPLRDVIPAGTVYVEPCAGGGDLIGHLDWLTCSAAYDISPSSPVIVQVDAVEVKPDKRMIVTNPPFQWTLLKPLLDHWIGKRVCWLLLPLDMLANKRTAPYMAHVDRIVPLGRVSWLNNGKGGMENFAWFRFDTKEQPFIARRA